MIRIGVVVSALLLLVASVPIHACDACGAFRAADGVKQPANIVIYRASGSSPDVFFNDVKVSARLNKAGHHVRVIESGVEATPEPDVNIVLASADEVERARATLGARCPNAVYLPVYEGFGKSESGSEPSLAQNSPMHHILGVLALAMQKLASN